jgi:hypothetical protein
MRTLLGCVAAICGAALFLPGPSWAAAPTDGADTQAKPANETVTKDDVKALATGYFERGVAARDKGDLPLARILLRSALRFDPQNTQAKVMLEQVEDALGITDADRIREKLELRIPEVKFEDADVKEVVGFLAKEADVNIVFDIAALSLLEVAAGAGGGAAPGMEPELEPEDIVLQPGEAAGAPPRVAAPTSRITLHLKNVPLREVLRYVLRFKGLRYIVEDYAILIVPIDWQPPESMVSETFHMTTSGVGAGRTVDQGFGGGGNWGTNNH